MYVVTTNRGNKNYPPTIEITELDAWNKVAEFVLGSMAVSGFLSSDESTNALHEVRYAFRISEKRKIIERFIKRAFPDKLRSQVVLDDGYVINDKKSEIVIQVFYVPF